METRGPIIIVGAGIAGLCTAIALAKVGFDVEIFEKADRIEPVGAGLQLSPNALRVLARVGLLDAVREKAVAADSVTLRSGRTGRAIAEVPVAGSDAMGYLALLRSDLQGALMNAAEREEQIRLHLGACVRVHREAGAPLVLSVEQNGETRSIKPWLTIGADGVHSTTADALGLPPARRTGMTALRLMLDGGEPDRGIEAWLGQRRHAVSYPVDSGRQTNLVLIVPSALSEAVDDSHAAAQLLKGWNDDLLGRVLAARFTGRWPLLEVPAERPLVFDDLCLIGDAGHAMLPFAAQGSAMAIEDAFVLAHELSFEPDRRMALRRFQAERAPRLAMVRRRVGFHRRVYHLPAPLTLGRDLVLAMRSSASLRQDLAWLYDWQP